MGKKSREKRERQREKPSSPRPLEDLLTPKDPATPAGVFRRYIDADFDGAQADVRRTALMKGIEAATGRKFITCAADPMKAAVGPLQIPVFIFQEDVTPLIDIFQSLPEGSDVDMLIESPGGSAQVVELIVRLLRKRFRSVRFLVPHTAMSAATMLVMSGDEILMDHRSSLGPIDPQIFRPGGIQYPAQNYPDWLDKAAEEERQTGKLSLVTLAILQKVTPADIQIAEDATEEARRLVTGWIAEHMWTDLRDQNGAPVPVEGKKSRARAVAEKLASHKEWLSHGKMLSMETPPRARPGTPDRGLLAAPLRRPDLGAVGQPALHVRKDGRVQDLRVVHLPHRQAGLHRGDRDTSEGRRQGQDGHRRRHLHQMRNQDEGSGKPRARAGASTRGHEVAERRSSGVSGMRGGARSKGRARKDPGGIREGRYSRVIVSEAGMDPKRANLMKAKEREEKAVPALVEFMRIVQAQDEEARKIPEQLQPDRASQYILLYSYR